MLEPDAFTTMPMTAVRSEPADECAEFLLLAWRASDSSFEGWERLRLRLAEQE